MFPPQCDNHNIPARPLVELCGLLELFLLPSIFCKLVKLVLLFVPEIVQGVPLEAQLQIHLDHLLRDLRPIIPKSPPPGHPARCPLNAALHFEVLHQDVQDLATKAAADRPRSQQGALEPKVRCASGAPCAKWRGERTARGEGGRAGGRGHPTDASLACPTERQTNTTLRGVNRRESGWTYIFGAPSPEREAWHVVTLRLNRSGPLKVAQDPRFSPSLPSPPTLDSIPVSSSEFPSGATSSSPRLTGTRISP